MDIKKTAVVAIVAVLLVSVAAIYYLNSDNPPPPHEPDYLEANEGLFQTEDFDLTDDKTGSWIRGTLYAMTDDDGHPLVRIMATVHIGPGNYYGASISGLINFVPVCFLSNYRGDPNSTDVVLYDFHDPRSYAVIGTSLKVYPAAGFINYAHHEVPKFVIDPGEMDQCTQLGFTHLKTTATAGMKMLLEAFKEL